VKTAEKLREELGDFYTHRPPPQEGAGEEGSSESSGSSGDSSSSSGEESEEKEEDPKDEVGREWRPGDDRKSESAIRRERAEKIQAKKDAETEKNQKELEKKELLKNPDDYEGITKMHLRASKAKRKLLGVLNAHEKKGTSLDDAGLFFN
jgi:hypothetical protein